MIIVLENGLENMRKTLKDIITYYIGIIVYYTSGSSSGRAWDCKSRGSRFDPDPGDKIKNLITKEIIV